MCLTFALETAKLFNDVTVQDRIHSRSVYIGTNMRIAAGAPLLMCTQIELTD